LGIGRFPSDSSRIIQESEELLFRRERKPLVIRRRPTGNLKISIWCSTVSREGSEKDKEDEMDIRAK